MMTALMLAMIVGLRRCEKLLDSGLPIYAVG
jgi:hypothetical protein